VAAVALAVGLVLADASVVILALPAIYREYNAEVADVAWVVTAFNLAIALAAVPAARLATRRPAGPVCAGGLVLFAAASAACALAPSLPFLIAARAVQGIGGAVAVCAALELLPALTAARLGSDPNRAAVRIWAAAGVAGAALGPAIGGLLTQLISWQAIFVVQVPLALIPAVVVYRRGGRVVAGRAGVPHIAANVALGLLSAGLAAVLFLLVLLLVEGWRMSPIAAAFAVTAMPVAALAVGPFERRLPSPRTRAAAGALLGAGGVAALGLLPHAGWEWTIAPQVLVGAGLALSLGALTEAALAGRSPAAIHGGWTIAARHAGVVLGLVLLTPVFVGDLDKQRERATQKGAELVLDAPVSALTKIDLAREIANDIKENPGRLPDIDRSFDAVGSNDDDRAALLKLKAQLNDQLDRAATSSFERSFLFAALLAGLALIPIALTRKVSL
jgi:predicted MFS family arabinose efflux permease